MRGKRQHIADETMRERSASRRYTPMGDVVDFIPVGSYLALKPLHTPPLIHREGAGTH